MSAVAATLSTEGLGLETETRTSIDRQAPDADLVQAARNGSHPAFEALVRRYSDRAYRVAWRVVRDDHQAEDVLQEAFIKAYRGLRNFESRSSFYTWLYRIVVNLALDRRRKDARGPTVEWDDTVTPNLDPRAVVGESVNPEVGMRRSEVRSLVSDGIETLPEAQREVLLLREVEGLSYEEIAGRMQISKGTVMSRLHYARKKMVVFLSQHGVTPGDVE